MGERDLEKQREWEPAAEPLIIENVDAPAPFRTGTRTVTVARDDELQLHISTEGTCAPDDIATLFEEDDLPLGTQMDPPTINLDNGIVIYEMVIFLTASTNAWYDPRTPGPVPFSQSGSVLRLKRRWTRRIEMDAAKEPQMQPLQAPGSRTDWYVNGPHSPLYDRWTKRRRSSSFSRQRAFKSVELQELPGCAGAVDHFVVETESAHFAVCRVPKNLAPDWCYPIAIEFLDPDIAEDTREAVAEIVSFVVGRRLLRVGSTLFDQSDFPLEEEALNPWAKGVHQLCSDEDHSPLDLGLAPSGRAAKSPRAILVHRSCRDRGPGRRRRGAPAVVFDILAAVRQ